MKGLVYIISNENIGFRMLYVFYLIDTLKVRFDSIGGCTYNFRINPQTSPPLKLNQSTLIVGQLLGFSDPPKYHLLGLLRLFAYLSGIQQLIMVGEGGLQRSGHPDIRRLPHPLACLPSRSRQHLSVPRSCPRLYHFSAISVPVHISARKPKPYAAAFLSALRATCENRTARSTGGSRRSDVTIIHSTLQLCV